MSLRCRLCAHEKPYNQLVDLKKDDDRKSIILEKLSRLCITEINLDSTDNDLGKMVCILCTESLDNAYDFVTMVEVAQSILRMHLDIKKDFNRESFCENSVKMKDLISETCSNESNIEIELSPNNSKQQFLKCSKSNGSIKLLNSDTSKNEHPNRPNTVLYKETLNVLPVCIKLKKINAKNIHSHKTIKGSNINMNNNIETITELSSWKDFSWMCAYCDTRFPHLHELQEHTMLLHGSCNVYRCTDCRSRKYQLDRFIKHVHTHENHLKLSCYKCFLTFISKRCLKSHENMHMNFKYKCNGCNQTFKDLIELTKHRDRYKKSYRHPLPPALQKLAVNLTCIKCKKTLKNKNSLKKHLLSHTNRQRNYICDKCGKRFMTKYQISEHMIVHVELKAHQCVICQKSFRSLFQLQEHNKLHNGQKPYSCNQCGKNFRLQKYLNSHVLVHTDIRPWICTICLKSFRFKNKLTEHKRQHTGEKPYSCKICQKAFTNWSNYNKHLKIRHSQKKT